jgi:hypothetical protein
MNGRNIYMVQVRCLPVAGGPQEGKATRAVGGIWVTADSPEQAIERAIEHAKPLGWVAQWQDVREVTRESHVHDESLLALFDYARLHGAASELHATVDPERN